MTAPRNDNGQFVKGFSYSPETQFRKGNVPQNKGKKFPGRGNKASFRKGNLPHNTLYDHAIRIRKVTGRKYKFIRIEPGKWEFLQRYNWVQKNGPIPAGLILVCKSDDPLNCDPGNWELKTRAEHAMANKSKAIGREVKPVIKKVRRCIECSKPLSGKGRSKFCSEECKKKNRKLHLPVQKCRNCGVEYVPTRKNSVFCSKTCAGTYWRRQHPKVKKQEPVVLHKLICEICGKEFLNRKSDTNCCSPECRRKYRLNYSKEWLRAHYDPEKRRQRKKTNAFPEKKCKICGSAFTPVRANQVYCSDDCRKEAASRYRREHYQPKPRSKNYNVQHRALSLKRKKKSEKVLIENMSALNRNITNDRERLKRKGIRSPDLTKMKYRHYDPVMKITRFFKSKERYQKFLKTLNKQS